MKAFVSIVRHDNGKVEKYQDFDTIEEAEEHSRIFGGFASATPNDNVCFWSIDETTNTLASDTSEFKAMAADIANKHNEQLRKIAYTSESDPLYFKYQRGEATEQEWLDKIVEIKARYPKAGE